MNPNGHRTPEKRMGQTSWGVGISTLRRLELVLLLDTVDRKAEEGGKGKKGGRDDGGKASLELLYIRFRIWTMQSGHNNSF